MTIARDNDKLLRTAEGFKTAVGNVKKAFP
jgi:hypothetical protein